LIYEEYQKFINSRKLLDTEQNFIEALKKLEQDKNFFDSFDFVIVD